jgi:hypothetical protein
MLSILQAIFLWLLWSQVEQISCQGQQSSLVCMGLFLVSISCFLAAVNVALGKKASQISTATYNPPIGYAAASRAVDGNTSSYLTQGSVAVTEIGQNPWWKVDLDGDYDVSRVVVYNRQDSCDVCLLKDFVVSLKNNTGFSLSSTERTSFRFLNRSVRVFDWWPPRHHVRYVTISSTAFTSIGLAEVQVYSGIHNWSVSSRHTCILCARH